MCSVHVKLLQSCLTLCDHMDYSPPGSSVQGILQARILEWVAMPSSRGSNQRLLRLLHWQVGSLPLAQPAAPLKAVWVLSERQSACMCLGVEW